MRTPTRLCPTRSCYPTRETCSQQWRKKGASLPSSTASPKTHSPDPDKNMPNYLVQSTMLTLSQHLRRPSLRQPPNISLVVYFSDGRSFWAVHTTPGQHPGKVIFASKAAFKFVVSVCQFQSAFLESSARKGRNTQFCFYPNLCI